MQGSLRHTLRASPDNEKPNMVMPATGETKERGVRLADPTLRRAVEAAVKRRIAGTDAEDVVQAALADVLCAARVPDDAEEFKRFVFAVTRNKVYDHFRRRQREVSEDQAHEPLASEPPVAARDMLRWAEEKLPDPESRHTLEWMLREGDGEKLEEIARDAQVPAPRIRQRVSRLRRFLRERWAAELMLGGVGVSLLVAAGIYWFAHREGPPPVAKPEPELRAEPPVTPELEGREVRRLALENCRNGEAMKCLDGLDHARALDPQGDNAPEVAAARRAAGALIAPAPSAIPTIAPAPTNAPAPKVAPKPHAAKYDSNSDFSSLPQRKTAPVPSFEGDSSSLDGSKPTDVAPAAKRAMKK